MNPPLALALGGAAEELLPGAVLAWGGGAGGEVEAALVEIDQPELAGRADDEVAEIGIAQAYAELQQSLPQLVKLLPQSIAKRGRLFGFADKITAERAAFDVGIHQERVAAEGSPAVFDAGDRARRGDAGIDQPMRKNPGCSGTRGMDRLFERVPPRRFDIVFQDKRLRIPDETHRSPCAAAAEWLAAIDERFGIGPERCGQVIGQRRAEMRDARERATVDVGACDLKGVGGQL